jgi:hypothetical protein
LTEKFAVVYETLKACHMRTLKWRANAHFAYRFKAYGALPIKNRFVYGYYLLSQRLAAIFFT